MHINERERLTKQLMENQDSLFHLVIQATAYESKSSQINYFVSSAFMIFLLDSLSMYQSGKGKYVSKINMLGSDL